MSRPPVPWDFDYEVAAEVLKEHVSMEDLANKYCREVRFFRSPTFTHSCKCPSRRHKGGFEKKSSFFFSEEGKFYKCFACQIHGDVFDFISLLEGTSRFESIYEIYCANGSGELPTTTRISNKEFSDTKLKKELELSSRIRDLLQSYKGKPQYPWLCTWANSVFIRMDETFSKIPNGEISRILSSYNQFNIEILRKVEEL